LIVVELVGQCEKLLRATNAEEENLIGQFPDKDASQSYLTDAYRFGDLTFEVLNAIGQGSRFHRLLVVYECAIAVRSADSADFS
jgi:hypothetical protein